MHRFFGRGNLVIMHIARLGTAANKMTSQCSEACKSGKGYKPLMKKYILEKYEVVETITGGIS